MTSLDDKASTKEQKVSINGEAFLSTLQLRDGPLDMTASGVLG